MGALLGMLGVSELDLEFVSKLGQQVVYDTIKEYLNLHNAEVAAMESVFVQATTTSYKTRYKLPEAGYMERLGGLAQPGATKYTGSWDVAFPLEDFGKAMMKDDVTMAYMSPAEMEAHVDGRRQADINTRRRELLKALFTNAAWTFEDEVGGDLSIQPLANGDSVLYPPVRGSVTEATRTRYAVTGYTNANISATNNPVVTARAALEKDFGRRTGGSNVVSFYNDAQIAKVKALATFTAVEDMNIQQGDDADRVINLPNVPGIVEGRCDGAWVVSWEWIPADYALSIHLDAPRPLMKRVDTPAARAALGLGDGLSLVATNSLFPLTQAIYRNRFGYGVGNRLNGYVQYFAGSGNYAVPTVG